MRRRPHDRKGFGVDAKLMASVKEYISQHPGVHPDAGLVVDFLRERFPEYSRRPVAALRTLVDRSLSAALANSDGSTSSESESGSSDSEVEVKTMEVPESASNAMNASLTATYKKSASGASPAAKRPRPVAQQLQGARKHAALAAAVARDAGVTPPAMAGEREGGMGPTPTPTLRYSDLGGVESALQEVRELIEYPLTHPEIYSHLGVDPPRGILLHGPPGCGKTMLANAIAGELGVPFFSIAAPEVVSGMSGESEAKIRSLFSEASQSAPCIVFIDEIDAITPKRDTAQREMERRIVAQLLTCLDGLTMESTRGMPVIVIGATNRPDSLDPALRRAGRFDREIALGIPDAAGRARILRVITKKLRLSGDFDFESIAKATGGYVGADLNALAKEAAVSAVHRIFASMFKPEEKPAAVVAVVPMAATPTAASQEMAVATATTAMSTDAPMEVVAPTSAAMAPAAAVEAARAKTPEAIDLEQRELVSNGLRSLREPLSEEQLAGLCITMEDFQKAVAKVQPSSKREGFSSIPDVRWEDVGALGGVRAQLIDAIVGPIKMPELYRAVGINSCSGVLLFGPPGCGKTLIAKAVACECGANFIGIKGPQLLNKYVGEAEKAVRQLFTRAATSSPCVIFFDELDALCPRRASDDGDHTGASRIVNQLLTEMDGLEARKDVFVIAATNRPDVIDPAMLRPGRLDKLIPVDLPDAAGREEILRTVCRTQRSPLAQDVDFAAVSRDPRSDGFSGADIAALVKEAALRVLHEALRSRGIAMDTSAAASPPATSAAAAATQSPLSPTAIVIRQAHFLAALGTVSRSVSVEDERSYLALKKTIHHVK